MKRYEVTISLKVRLSASSPISAGLDVLRFVRYLIASAEWGRGMVVEGPDSISSDQVKELPF